MSAIRKTLLCMACMLMAFSTMGRERELLRQESDSVSHALATIWSKSYRNIAANDGKAIGAEFMRGIQDVLTAHIDSTQVANPSDGNTTKAYKVGMSQGITMTQLIKELEKRGGFKVDVKRLKYVLSNIEKGRPSGFSEQTARLFMKWLLDKIDKENYQIDGSEAYLRSIEQRQGVIKTPSGLLFEVLTEGEGESPDANDLVYIKFECRLIDNTVTSRSDERNNSILSVNETIKGFGEGLQLMKIGGKYRLYIPSELGYGDIGSKNIPGGAATIFDVELLDFRRVDADGNFGDSELQKKAKEKEKQQ